MGNQQNLTFANLQNVANDLEKPDHSSNSLQLSRDNLENPLKKYLNQRAPLTIKTLTSIKKKHVAKAANLQKPVFARIQQLETENGRNSSRPEGSEVLNSVKNKENSSLAQIQKYQQLQNYPQQQKLIDNPRVFKSLKIKNQQFLQVKSEPIQDFYEIKQIIGEGTFGQVFRAVCKATGEQMAIKHLKSKYMKAHAHECVVQAKLLAKIQHPSIIKVYDIFINKNSYYVVMEYCKGGSIIDMIDRFERKSERLIANIIKQLLGALSYLHSMNIVHRDIKLENIVFLEPNIEDQKDLIPIKIIDFGTAVETKVKETSNFPKAGTLTYLAPEVFSGKLTEKSDIWSSAVLITILLTGVSPFNGSNDAEIKAKILEKQLRYGEYPLKTVSKQAKNLLSLMFERNHRIRISAAQALKHPWFSLQEMPKQHSLNLQKLQKYHKSNNFISVIQSYLSIRKINQAERQKLAKIFNQIDFNYSGCIEAEELKGFLNRHHPNEYQAEEIENIILQIDKNRSGKIDFDEFMLAMYSRQKLFIRESLNQAFNYFDKDHTGYIEKKELQSILKGSGKEEVQYFVQELDIDKDNKISREEFIDYLSKF